MNGPANPSLTVPLIEPMLNALKEANPEIESWAILGFCWGGKVATLVSGEGSSFKASAQAHPSLLDVQDAREVRIPHCVLPSNDEVPEVCSPLSPSPSPSLCPSTSPFIHLPLRYN